MAPKNKGPIPKRPQPEGGEKYAAGIGVICLVALGVALYFNPETPVEVYNKLPVDYPEHADMRPRMCPRLLKAKCKQDSVSIIIPYLNEEWFRIRATMQSLLKYTDMRLVHEIMWVADGCKPDKIFAEELQKMHPTVKVHINPENLGLITTKMQAVERAGGSILMFLEPHILATSGWLPPLVNRLNENPRLLIQPMLDVLDEDMNTQQASHGHWRFEWNLNIAYTDPLRLSSKPQEKKPYPSPATSGGIYMIRKDFWQRLDFFDPKLIRWGGDHVEASLKVWRCGGRIEIHPCSRIGHWFRVESNRPYDVKWESVSANYKRLAEVWFDNYTDVFYKVRPETKSYDVGDLSDMKSRRDKMGCKGMDWYVKKIDLEMDWEADRVCIPGASKSIGGCGEGTTAVERMSTIVDYIPEEEYQRRLVTTKIFETKKNAGDTKGHHHDDGEL